MSVLGNRHPPTRVSIEKVLHPGDLVHGRYRIESVLGRGGFARTFIARQVADEAEVVIKFLPVAGAGDWKVFELFEREVRVLAALAHPAIPEYADHFELSEPAGFCLVQRRAPGRSLADRVASGWNPNELEVVAIADQLLEILTYLHQREPACIHRDIKPENIIIDDDGRVSLVDFGAVTQLAGASASGDTVVGTFGFMAPEQARGQAEARSDLYSVGCTLIFLVSHRLPTDLPCDGLRFDLRGLTLSPWLRAWLARMLEPALEDRYSSAAIARGGLDERDVPAGNRRGVPVALAIAAAAAVGIGGYGWYAGSRDESPPPPPPSIPVHTVAIANPTRTPAVSADPSGGTGALLLDHQARLEPAGAAPHPERALTSEIWVRPLDPSYSQLSVSAPGISFDLYNGIAYACGLLSSRVSVIHPGRWYHLACVHDLDHNRLYLDGREVASTATPSPSLEVSGLGMIFFPSQGARLAVADLRVWDRVRTGDEIRRDMLHRLEGNEPGLVGYWPMDKPSGDDLIDITGHWSRTKSTPATPEERYRLTWTRETPFPGGPR